MRCPVVLAVLTAVTVHLAAAGCSGPRSGPSPAAAADRPAPVAAVAPVATAAPAADIAPAARAPAGPAFTVRVVGAGSPVVLIPGLACSGDVWTATAERLGAHHEVHVLTLAGFGGQPASAGPVLDRARVELIAYVRDRRLVRPVIVGHSLGGFLALWVAATAPDAVGGVMAVDGVPFLSALMDPEVTADGIRPQAAALRDRLAAMTPAQFGEQNRGALAMMITDPAEVERVAATSARSDPAAVAAALYEIMTTDLRTAVAAIRVPTVVIAPASYASNDAEQREVLARYQRQVAAIPDHRVVVAGRARHFVMLDDPALFFAQLEPLLAAAVAP
jgi:pimeloyl-ACP methyl ester carboxylesterase